MNVTAPLSIPFYKGLSLICSGLLIPDTHLGRECSP